MTIKQFFNPDDGSRLDLQVWASDIRTLDGRVIAPLAGGCGSRPGTRSSSPRTWTTRRSSAWFVSG